jgi:hypothetical protein
MLVISLVIFGLTVLIWAGISFGYIPFLSSQLKQVNADFESLSKRISPDQQKSLTDFYSQLYNIQNLQASHKYPAKIFDFLEKNTYPMVNITNFQVNLEGGDIRFSGIAVDYQTLVNQLAVLKSDPNVNSVVLESSQKKDVKEGGGVSFSIKMSIKTSFFNSN